ncbi:MAG: hypothetical protein ACPGFC_08720, partial [Paracoccaceae bacterium]
MIYLFVSVNVCGSHKARQWRLSQAIAPQDPSKKISGRTAMTYSTRRVPYRARSLAGPCAAL